MFLRFALIVGFVEFVRGDGCVDLCTEIEDCKNSDHSSYCKDSGECFGLFYEDKSVTTMCFFPVNNECSQDLPVLCPLKPDAQS
jgi:hypothetical protein